MSLWKMLATTATAAMIGIGGASAQTVRVGLNDEPDALDPTISQAYTARMVLTNICDKLFDMTPDLKLVHMLATEHEWSDDRTSLTLKLRPNVEFHDGEPFNAEAVKFNIERHQTMAGSLRKSEVGAIKSMDVIDDLTIRFNLDEPLVPLIAALSDRAGMMVSPKAAAELGDRFGTQPVCAGPFKFVDRVAQGAISVEKFENYWDADKVRVEAAEFTPITDSTVRISNLRSGQLDIIERVSPTDLEQLRSDPGTEVTSYAEQGYTVVRYNVAHGPKGEKLGSDPRIREAIEAAIDRKILTEVVFNGEYVPGNQPFDPSNFYYNADFPVPERDVEKAKRLLEEAGAPDFTFTLIVPPERDRQEAAQVMQAMLAEAGITMNIETQENVTMLQAGREGDFEAYFTFWSGRPDPDGNLFTHYACNGPLNHSAYCSEEFTRLVTEARKVSDENERKKLYDEAAALMIEDRPSLIVWHRMIFTGLRKEIDGFVPHSDGLIRLKGVSKES